jgi:hypothetical protein
VADQENQENEIYLQKLLSCEYGELCFHFHVNFDLIGNVLVLINHLLQICVFTFSFCVLVPSSLETISASKGVGPASKL